MNRCWSEDVDSKPAASPRPIADPSLVPKTSPWLLEWFQWYVARYLAQHFHAVRLSRRDRAEAVTDEPLVVYMNHAGWWDPLIGLCMARRMFPDRKHFAPVEESALAKYRFMRRLGLFGIDTDSPRGAARFLRISMAILSEQGRVLWLTPEGRFCDCRQRAEFRPGLAHLARRNPRLVLLPMAVEYPFWQERTPEALVRFGLPTRSDEVGERSAAQWTELLQDRLHAVQDALQTQSTARDALGFETVIHGSSGVGGVYDMWRRILAWLRGRRFRPEHSTDEPSSA